MGTAPPTVVVLAPSHRETFRGVSVYSGDSYTTPLGDVAIDTDLRDHLKDLAPDTITVGDAGHGDEHAVEVQIPFVQRLFPKSTILPITMLERRGDVCRLLGCALAMLRRERPFLLIASSDLYHGPSLDDCNETDERTLTAIQVGDPDAFLDGIQRGDYQACGAGPIAALLHATMTEHGTEIDILRHGTSADVNGEHSGYVVGYAAIAVGNRTSTKDAPTPDVPNPTHSAVDPTPSVEGVTPPDRTLLETARQAIEDGLQGRRAHQDRGTAEDSGGVFVTLRKRGRLRGCIGLTRRAEDLLSTVRDAAEGAAFRDPRFAPVDTDELAEIKIEISLLTPLEVLGDVSPNSIRVGRDGLQIELGGQRGLLLPQVPVELGWDETRFLEETCRKADLPADAWMDPKAVIKIFAARKFSEDER